MNIDTSCKMDLFVCGLTLCFFFLFFLAMMQPLSILCRSLRDIDTYTMGFPRGDGHGHANVFRAVKQCLPGPVRYSMTLV